MSDPDANGFSPAAPAFAEQPPAPEAPQPESDGHGAARLPAAAQAEDQPAAAPADPPAPSLFAPTLPLQAPAPPLQAPAAPAPSQPPVGTGTAAIFRLDQERLAALHDLNRRRARVLLWALAVGVALGLLLLIPAVHVSAVPALPPHRVGHLLPVSHQAGTGRPVWASILQVVGIGAPLLALALGLIALPFLLWREVWLRRQGDLHLAIGRQGLLFFLPGQAGRWFLLPWGHITALTDATTSPRTGRRARLRVVLWRRWARLQRAFRHGGRLIRPSAEGTPTRSPFLLRARAAAAQQRLRVACYARLPDSGYGWLFSLAPFTRRVGPAAFVLETGWFESIAASQPAAAPRGRASKHAPPAGALQRLLLGLWAASLARARRAPLPLPRSGGAVLLSTPAPDHAAEPAARRIDGAAWAALLLVPALSAAVAGITLARRQPLDSGDALNAVALCVLTPGLALLLAGIRWTRRERLFAGGAFLLALAGALNVAYGVVALLQDWPWTFQTAPGQPFFFLEALAGLLLLLGGAALGLEGIGRPGAPAATSQRARPHSAELALALGLLALGLARVLENIDLAALGSGAATLQWLRDTLAQPLLPLAIIGLSYFAWLAGPALQKLFRALQAIYGLTLALLAPAAFIFVYRAAGGTRPLPLEWLPLIALELICGLLVVFFSLRARR